MTSKQLSLAVRPRGKPIRGLPEETNISASDTAEQLYKKIAAESKFSIHRLRITKGSDGAAIPNSKDVTVHDTGLRDQSTINVKDLGPQIGWQTCYLIEYAGPMLIHPLIYFLRPYIYRNATEPASHQQFMAMILVTLHFLKRELETLFVHRFSLATMPFFNVYKNSGHYWLIAGLNIAYWTYAPTALAATHPDPRIMYAGIVLFVIGEFENFRAHMTLRNLRKPGSTERGIPQGYGFKLVTCPNYMWETVAWIGIMLCTMSASTAVFMVPAVGQMAAWAKKREYRYRKEFPDKYKKKRFAILPGIY
ncbi:enoyl reductase [Pseudovirgaria hyperparasitica]|uniref:very-long-chain enoyl-CoA reductase n=1 Tax=Pseudovirgaria hyperparasitica TaxID=470096 RepID=A0A6A6WF59_9PEZI|nr:enoyl reductase [Pseudovirgaria hyperparasitica]KAF2760620.1 enoyl reductase [Pseudovirgaria hyperparasitica]